MADQPASPDSGDDDAARPEHRATTGAPRWVKAFGVVALVLAVLVAVLVLAGVGDHGPGRHLPSGQLEEGAAPGAAAGEPPAAAAGGAPGAVVRW